MKRPTEKFTQHVASQSSRNGVPIKAIVLHDTEGANLPGITDLRVLGNVFESRGVSAHVGIDADGHSACYVDDDRKAWHCADYNSQTLGIEQIGFAKFTERKWKSRPHQLQKTAQYIAHWSAKHHVPIRRARVYGGSVIRSGVTTHKALGSRGGSHVDPGPGYPLGYVLRLARRYKRKGHF